MYTHCIRPTGPSSSVRERCNLPAFPGAQRGRRDANGSREACDPLVAVNGATGLLQEVGGCVELSFPQHDRQFAGQAPVTPISSVVAAPVP